MSFQLGAITGTMSYDISPFTRSFLQATSIAQLFPATITNFIANPLLGVVGIAKSAAESIKGAFVEVGHAADDAGEAAEKAGVSVEFLTGVGAAFADAGSSAEGLADSLKFLNKNAADAAAGNATAVASFRKLGLSASFVRANLSDTQTLFLSVADSIARLQTTAEKTNSAMDLLGRGGADAIAALNKGSGGLQQFAADIAKLGGTTSQSLADAGDKFGTLSVLLNASLQGVRKAAAQPILESLARHFDEIRTGLLSVVPQIQSAITTAVSAAVSFVEAKGPAIARVAASVASAIRATVTGTASAIGAAMSFTRGHADQLKIAIAGLAGAFAAVKIFGLAQSLTSLGGILRGVGGAIAAVAGFLSAPVTIVALIGVAIGSLLAKMGLLTPAWNAIKSAAGTFVAWVQSSAIPAIGAGLSAAFHYIVPAVQAAASAIAAAWPVVSGFVSQAVAPAATAIRAGLGAAMQFLQPYIAGVMRGFAAARPLFSAVGYAVLALGRIFASGLVTGLSVAWRVMSAVASFTAGAFTKAFNFASPVLSFFGNLIGWAAQKLGEFLGWIGRGALAVDRFFGIAPPESGSSAAHSATAAASSAVAPVANGAGTSTSNLSSGLKDATKAAASVAPAINSNVVAPFVAVKSSADDALDSVRDFHAGLNDLSSARLDLSSVTAGGTPQSAGAGGGAAVTTININNPMFPKVDAGEATTQIAQKMRPMIDESVRSQLASMHAAAANLNVKGGL